MRRTVYTAEDKEWFRTLVSQLKTTNNFNFPGARKYNVLGLYKSRFNRELSLEAIMNILTRTVDPEYSKKQYLKAKEREKLRKDGLLPRSSRQPNQQNIGETLSKYPFIIVIGSKVAGYETEEQIKEAIVESQLIPNAMKVFEVKERRIKSQIIVDIE